MWRSGVLSVFSDPSVDNPKDEAGQSSNGITGQQSGQIDVGGQISAGGMEHADLSGEDIFMGTEMNDEWLAQNSLLFQDSSSLAPLPDNYDFLLSPGRYTAPASPGITPGLSTVCFDTTERNQDQDFGLPPSVHHSVSNSQLDSIPRPRPDEVQLHQSNFIDFDIRSLQFENGASYQPTRPSPAALLSPALTPPPSISSKPQDTIPSTFQTDDQRLQATLARSRTADKFFVYGVTTTKIFCRPSCPSRRACYRNIVFFSFPNAVEAATAANFRPCKRCKPEAVGTVDTGILGVIKVIRLIMADASSPFSTAAKNTKLESLAETGGLSAFHFHRLFKAITQLTPGELIASSRSLALGDALGKDSRESRSKFDASALITTSATWKPRTARKALGSISPSNYANGSLDLKIECVSIDTPFGPMWIVYTPSGGILAVLLGKDADKRAKARFPGVVDSEAHAGDLGRCVRELQEEGGDREGDIPEDVKPMLWRARVWVRLVRDTTFREAPVMKM